MRWFLIVGLCWANLAVWAQTPSRFWQTDSSGVQRVGIRNEKGKIKVPAQYVRIDSLPNGGYCACMGEATDAPRPIATPRVQPWALPSTSLHQCQIYTAKLKQVGGLYQRVWVLRKAILAEIGDDMQLLRTEDLRIQARHHRIFPLDAQGALGYTFRAEAGGSYGFLHADGTPALPASYADVRRNLPLLADSATETQAASNWLLVRQQDMFGLVDSYTQIEVVPPKYTQIAWLDSSFQYLAVCEKDSLGKLLWGIRRASDGRVLLVPSIAQLSVLAGHFWQAELPNGRFGILDARLVEWVHAPDLTRIEPITNYWILSRPTDNGKQTYQALASAATAELVLPFAYSQLKLAATETPRPAPRTHRSEPKRLLARANLLWAYKDAQQGLYDLAANEWILSPVYDRILNHRGFQAKDAPAVSQPYPFFALQMGQRYGLFCPKRLAIILRPEWTSIQFVQSGVLFVRNADRSALYSLESGKLTDIPELTQKLPLHWEATLPAPVRTPVLAYPPDGILTMGVSEQLATPATTPATSHPSHSLQFVQASSGETLPPHSLPKLPQATELFASGNRIFMRNVPDTLLVLQNGRVTVEAQDRAARDSLRWETRLVADFTGDGKAESLQLAYGETALHIRVMHFGTGAAVLWKQALSVPPGARLADDATLPSLADLTGDGVSDILLPLTWRYEDASQPPGGVLYALNSRGGHTLWKYDMAAVLQAEGNRLLQRPLTQLSAAGWVVYLPFSNGTVVRLNAWGYPLGVTQADLPTGSHATAIFPLPGKPNTYVASVIVPMVEDFEPEDAFWEISPARQSVHQLLFFQQGGYSGSLRHGSYLYHSETTQRIAVGAGVPSIAGAQGMLMADVLGVGKAQIVVANPAGIVRLFDMQGEQQAVYAAPAPLSALPTLADIDGQGRQKLLLPTQDAKLHCYKLLSSQLPPWPSLHGDAANTGFLPFK